MGGPGKRERFGFVGGIRTFAAFQVFILHYGGAFVPLAVGLPGVAHFSWERGFHTSPGFFLAGGSTAVGIFFLLSGFVLAPSFLSPRLNLGQNLLKRLLRLTLPALGAAALAVALLALLPTARHQAAGAVPSPWLDALVRGPTGLWDGLRGMARDVVLGVQGFSIASVSPVSNHLPLAPLSASTDTPVWALHWELWGSVLIAIVAKAYRRLPPGAFWVGFGVLAVVCGTSFLALFLIGFLAYLWRARILRPDLGLALVGLGLVVTSVVVAVHAPTSPTLPGLLRMLPGLKPLSTYEFFNEVSALAFFLGVLLCAPLRTLLSCRPLQWLGTVSFSVYLVHFIVLVTLASAVFTAAAPHGYAAAVVLAVAVGLVATVVISVLFERLVDRPATRAAQGCAEWAGRSPARPATPPARPATPPVRSTPPWA